MNPYIPRAGDLHILDYGDIQEVVVLLRLYESRHPELIGWWECLRAETGRITQLCTYPNSTKCHRQIIRNGVTIVDRQEG